LRPGLNLCRVASMVASPQVTRHVLAVLVALIEEGGPIHGAALMKRTGLKSGTLYPILDRLERAEWINGEWEDVDPSQVKRPRRRSYVLTGEGEQVTRAEVRAAQRALSEFQGLAWGS
jgi:PadR family transcriptional regulator PadR